MCFFPTELSELSELGVLGTRYGGPEAVPGRILVGRREAPQSFRRRRAKLFYTARSAVTTIRNQLSYFLTKETQIKSNESIMSRYNHHSLRVLSF